MSDSIFDWDDDEDKPEAQPVRTVVDPPQSVEEQPPQTEPSQPPPSRWDRFDSSSEPLELGPAPFENNSSQGEPPTFGQTYPRDEPLPPVYDSDPFAQPAGMPEKLEPPSATGFEPDPFGYDTVTKQDAAANYPFGYQPDPFPVAPPAEYVSESKEETSRRSSMAFSAGIAFFGAVVFMLFLGWIADWLIGSSPWGLVGGIVLGSIIGLVQFIRITSSIFVSDKSQLQVHPLMQHDDEKKPPDSGF